VQPTLKILAGMQRWAALTPESSQPQSRGESSGSITSRAMSCSRSRRWLRRRALPQTGRRCHRWPDPGLRAPRTAPRRATHRGESSTWGQSRRVTDARDAVRLPRLPRLRAAFTGLRTRTSRLRERLTKSLIYPSLVSALRTIIAERRLGGQNVAEEQRAEREPGDDADEQAHVERHGHQHEQELQRGGHHCGAHRCQSGQLQRGGHHCDARAAGQDSCAALCAVLATLLRAPLCASLEASCADH